MSVIDFHRTREGNSNQSSIINVIVTDDYSDLTTAGFFSCQSGDGIITQGLNPEIIVGGDVLDVYYSWDTATQTGTFTRLLVSISDDVATLVPSVPVVGEFISFDVVCDHADLASGGEVTLVSSVDAQQFKPISLQLNKVGTNFSGGSGDRLGQVTDGTTVYSVIPAASLQTLVNAQWGATALPNPASASINTSTAPGQPLVFKYSGGTLDYTAGSLTLSGLVQRVA